MVLEDDLDGSEANETLNFSVDGTEYEIDLNADHANELRSALSPYTNAVRKVTSGRSRPVGLTMVLLLPVRRRAWCSIFVSVAGWANPRLQCSWHVDPSYALRTSRLKRHSVLLHVVQARIVTLVGVIGAPWSG